MVGDSVEWLVKDVVMFCREWRLLGSRERFAPAGMNGGEELVAVGLTLVAPEHIA